MHRPADQGLSGMARQQNVAAYGNRDSALDVQFRHQVGQGLQGLPPLVLQGDQFAFLALALVMSVAAGTGRRPAPSALRTWRTIQ